MAIQMMQMESKGMQTAISFVKKMTKSMTFDENMDQANWPKARRRNNLFYRLMPKEDGVKFQKVQIGTEKALLAEYKKPGDDHIIIYLHGGGFVTGSAFVCKSYASMLAKYSGYKVYAVDYSLAPEHPYPQGFNDCSAAFEALVEMYPNATFTVIGESAGGCFSLILALKFKELHKITSVIVHSPTVDFSGVVDHNQNENKDFIVMKGCSEALKRMYVREANVENFYVSPIYGDFNDYPPTFITCDINETLYGDSVALYEKLVEAGVPVEMIKAEGAYHAFAVTGTNAPETTKILEENVAFMKKYL